MNFTERPIDSPMLYPQAYYLTVASQAIKAKYADGT